MADIHDIRTGLGDDGQLNLDGEVFFAKNLSEMISSSEQMVRLNYNALVNCQQGRVEFEMGGEGNKKVVAQSGQLLLLPANKLMQPMMVSTDLKASVLLVSDKALREVMGPHIDLWNRAMFMSEIYVIDGGQWVKGALIYADTLLGNATANKQVRLFREIVISFLRTMFLMICETLSRRIEVTDGTPAGGDSTHGERNIFDRFLSLLAKESNKRQQVGYYAKLLNITPKYLSTVCSRVSGKSPMRWIMESVMEDIYQLLRNTNLSVKEISGKMGFPNSSYFGQYFREQTGMTPLEYRNKSKAVQ